MESLAPEFKSTFIVERLWQRRYNAYDTRFVDLNGIVIVLAYSKQFFFFPNTPMQVDVF